MNTPVTAPVFIEEDSFKKSSRSGSSGGDCVEVAAGVLLVGDNSNSRTA